MRTTGEWKDFEIIASGGGEKLERWGSVFLLRPDPQAIWRAGFDFTKFEKLNAKYTRSASGGGSWDILKKMPDEWVIEYRNLKFLISPTSFKHTGLFPEQAVNWDRMSMIIKNPSSTVSSRTEIICDNSYAIKKGAAVLNLFGYTGGATVACAKAGAVVTHVDASKGMVEVCKRNCKLNNLPDTSVRFIVDDCIKFVEREIRRGKRYDAIIMDPPSFGRGANGEVWKIEEHLDYLVGKCCRLLSDKPLFFLINSYTTGLQPTVMKNLLATNLEKHASIESYEIGLPTNEGIVLPAGCSALATFKEAKA